jgi:hypothetical protein
MNMKTVKKLILATIAALVLPLSFSSCEKDDHDNNDNQNSNDAKFEAIARQYVDNTINLTYSLLATETQNLYEDLLALKNKVKGGEQASQEEID